MGRHKKERWKYIDNPKIKKDYYLISNWENLKNKKVKNFRLIQIKMGMLDVHYMEKMENQNIIYGGTSNRDSLKIAPTIIENPKPSKINTI